MTQIPVFVYGTLREGYSNFYRCLEGKVGSIQKATLADHEMYDVGYYPAIVPGEGEVVGEIMFIDPEKYDQVVRSLDYLEGYDFRNEERSMYLRRVLEVKFEDGRTTDAHVYIWNRELPQRKIENGDWTTTKRAQENKVMCRGYANMRNKKYAAVR